MDINVSVDNLALDIVILRVPIYMLDNCFSFIWQREESLSNKAMYPEIPALIACSQPNHLASSFESVNVKYFSSHFLIDVHTPYTSVI